MLFFESKFTLPVLTFQSRSAVTDRTTSIARSPSDNNHGITTPKTFNRNVSGRQTIHDPVHPSRPKPNNRPESSANTPSNGGGGILYRDTISGILVKIRVKRFREKIYF
jgi:hypothetical protein